MFRYKIEGNESVGVAWMRIGRDVAGMRMGLLVRDEEWLCGMKMGVVLDEDGVGAG